MSDNSSLEPYFWVVVCGCICGFIYAFGIGANDVANAFASSVSSRSLTLKQAVVVAGIFEFLGAILLGASVTSTIKDNIVFLDQYEDKPEVLMYGMFTSLFTGMIMLLVATYFALPVSTTHTIVGSIIGFSICAEGVHSVNWEATKKIFISWVASPLIAGSFSFVFFGLLRIFVLHTENAAQRAYYTFPIVLFVGITINVFYILYKVGHNFNTDDLPIGVIVGSAFGCGVGVALLWLWPIGPIAKKRIDAGQVQLAPGVSTKNRPAGKDTDTDLASGHPVNPEEEVEETPAVEGEDKGVDKEQDDNKEKDGNNAAPAEGARQESKPSFSSSLRRLSQSFADNTYNQDLAGQSMAENAKAKEIWNNAELYDEDAEMMFTYLQVFTASMNSFAHGANDIANSIGPISAILNIYQSGGVSSKAPVQKWVLAYGGIAIVLGLLTFGYRVMKSIGYKLTIMSPSRGATAELAASLTVVTASFRAIPVSSTQIIVGAISGVGLTQGWRNVQWLFLARVCVGWAVIFFVSAVLSAGVFSFGAFGPSLVN